jgi:dTDP-4-dehydrorhamnose 3,5-epimerase
VIFLETSLPGAFVIELEPITDERGLFARTFCAEEFEANDLDPAIVQCNLSYNSLRGTLRGMHFQEAPYAECKLVRCTAGAIYDVIVDLRPESPTHCKWFAVELSATNRRMLYVPGEGFAHGFQTLADGSEVFYQMSHVYVPSYARGVRWDDPAFGIEWPTGERVISKNDRQYPDYEP